jgi:outer membrane lipoprotein-sorting protein
MKTVAAAAATLAALASLPGTARATSAGDEALAAFSTAWAGVKTYTCTITAHEVKGRDVQDRVYHVAFMRPNNMRMDIVGGAGRGGAAVWTGGSTLFGHQGGFLSFVKLHLNIHDPKAVSLRGTTVAQASFGALLDRVKSLKIATLDAKTQNGLTRMSAQIAGAAPEKDVTSILMVFAANHLPVEYDEYMGSTVVDHVVYSNYMGNVTLPDSTWKI